MRARRLPVADEIHEGGESVVLLDGNVLLLSALATSLLRGVGDGAELSEVADALGVEFGLPPDGVSPLDLTVVKARELVEQGLLELR